MFIIFIVQAYLNFDIEINITSIIINISIYKINDLMMNHSPFFAVFQKKQSKLFFS